MNHRVTRRTFTLLACGAGALSTARGATVWRIATGYPLENFHTANLIAMAKDVELATQGQLHIDVYPKNSLYALNAIQSAVQDGKVEAGEVIMSSLVADLPIAGADSVPFITDSYADALRLWRIQRPLIEKAFASRGLEVLYAVPWPPQGLYSTRPLGGLGDMRGMRMRTFNANTAKIATLMGTEAVDVPATELNKALADGRIDCMMTSAVTGVESRAWQSMHYFYEINAFFPKNIVFANKKAWDAIGAPLREALKNASAAAELRGWSNSASVAAQSLEELKRSGMKIESPSYLFGRDVKRLGERFSLDWVKQVGVSANDVFIPYFDKR
ncbi:MULTISPECIES: TRAP transporter substrate-binding protein [Variovorax]|jgi:TRAP-type C4-dicarboxylate transport system substrate-binding protein|uniref:TRAP transporter substrate-binding protein n=1 Tax=Variovorax TaxID=34072 RepID=UPI0008969BE7|nr:MULTISPECIES: TRAP transporter substrate-binding protein [unclassified Variovorax]SDZ47690.1 TRAP-type C4-dicarboxylate transport system, substrate-binding protein [Variovorax sp. YR266]SOD28661.1 TRAP-type C4-dicarboxylate transport system, substrate-binding protein [Variovorax sp. YR752]